MVTKKIKCPKCDYEMTIEYSRLHNMDDLLDIMEKKDLGEKVAEN